MINVFSFFGKSFERMTDDELGVQFLKITNSLKGKGLEAEGRAKISQAVQEAITQELREYRKHLHVEILASLDQHFKKGHTLANAVDFTGQELNHRLKIRDGVSRLEAALGWQPGMRGDSLKLSR